MLTLSESKIEAPKVAKEEKIDDNQKQKYISGKIIYCYKHYIENELKMTRDKHSKKLYIYDVGGTKNPWNDAGLSFLFES